MDVSKIDIGQLEKAVNTLIGHPHLIRHEYWVSQIDSLLERPSLSAPDRRRLCALLALLDTVTPTSSQ
jgi:hypothetical protein